MNCILYVPAVLFSDLSVVSTPTKCLKGVYLFESRLCDVHKKFNKIVAAINHSGQSEK